MKNLKRLIALVAVFALALTTIASAATFTDVAEDSAYYEAVETLTKLGIVDGMPDGTYQPEKVVTRAEMAKLIATMQGLGDTAQSGSATKFTDVPASHWASGYIANATGVAIAGYPDGTFGPDQNVKFEQAVKMIMATLGYTVVANGNGGYPMGFVSAAIKEGVVDGVANANVGTDANRGTIAQLIYNAIDTPLVEQITWEADGSGEYTKYDGTGNKAYKTLMSENLDVVKMKGHVIANSYMAVTSEKQPTAIDKEEENPTVAITVENTYKVITKEFHDDNKELVYDVTPYDFVLGDSDADKYVGKAVIYFAMENDYEDWEVISVTEDSTYNKSVTFSLTDVDLEKTVDIDDEIWYYKDGASKSTKLNMESDVKVLYNNAYLAEDSLLSLLTTLYNGKFGGEVTVVDAYKNAGYDLVIVEAATSAVVKEVSKANITLKGNSNAYPNGGAISKIDTDDDEAYVVLMKDGAEITVDQIAENDVLSIVGVRNGLYTVIEVMSNTIEGSVSAAKPSETSSTGKAYRIDGTYYDATASARTVLSGIQVGDAGTFYIDKYGKIAYYDESSVIGGNYAYVLETLIDEDSWGNKVFEIKLVTKDGVKTYKTADKVKINDSTKVVDDEAEVAISGNAYGLEGKVVDVTFSGEYIKAIRTAGDDVDEDGFAVAGDGVVSGRYDAEDIEIGTKAYNEDSIVFYIGCTYPEDNEETDVDESATRDGFKDSKCYVGTLADLEDGATVRGDAYEDKNNDEDANIIVLYDAIATVGSASNVAIVLGYEDATNEDEESIYALELLYNGEKVTYNTDADVAEDMYDGLTEGDIVKIKVNGNNIITALEPVFNFGEDVRYYDVEVEGETNEISTVEELAAAYAGYSGDDTFVYAPIGNYKDSTKAFGFNGAELGKLSEAKNIYVIDATSRNLDIYAGGTGDYYFDETLVKADKSDWASITLDVDGVEGTRTPSEVADMVIFRSYDGDTVEAIIIKGIDSADYDIHED